MAVPPSSPPSSAVAAASAPGARNTRARRQRDQRRTKNGGQRRRGSGGGEPPLARHDAPASAGRRHEVRLGRGVTCPAAATAAGGGEHSCSLRRVCLPAACKEEGPEKMGYTAGTIEVGSASVAPPHRCLERFFERANQPTTIACTCYLRAT